MLSSFSFFILKKFYLDSLSEITIVSVKIKKINRPKYSKSGSIKSLIGAQKKRWQQKLKVLAMF